MPEPLRVQRIVVPIDGSAGSRDAAVQGLRIAAAYGAEVCFVHAVDENVVSALARHEAGVAQHESRERLHAQGESHLHAAARLAAEQGVQCTTQVIAGDPCTVIVDVAEKRHAQLIVIGRSGQRGARRLLGSVTRRVIECSDTPVLVVTGPPHG